MKYLKLIYFTLIVFAFSCNKEEEKKKPDNILYTDIIPDSTISSLDSLVYIGRDDYGDCYKPYPKDSTACFNLDINNDGQVDFRVCHSHWYGADRLSPHNWCGVYQNYSV